MTGENEGETLEDLAAEASQIDADAEREEFEEENFSEPPQADPQLASVIGALLKAAADIICVRAGVSALSDSEALAVGSASAGVIAFYDIRPTSEAAVWMGLGVAVAGVTIPRLVEYQMIAREDKPANLSPAPKPPTQGPIVDGGIL